MILDDFDLNSCPRCGNVVQMEYVTQYEGKAPWRMLCARCGTQARGFTRSRCRELWNTWNCVQILVEEADA